MPAENTSPSAGNLSSTAIDAELGRGVASRAGTRARRSEERRPRRPAALLKLSGLIFVDLQYGDTSWEKRELKSAHGVNIATVAEIDNFNDIDGLAALIAACDLAITESNTAAHPADTLGKKTLLMAPKARGKFWCWRRVGGTSLRYPSIRIFAQTERGRWARPVAEVRRYPETRR